MLGNTVGLVKLSAVIVCLMMTVSRPCLADTGHDGHQYEHPLATIERSEETPREAQDFSHAHQRYDEGRNGGRPVMQGHAVIDHYEQQGHRFPQGHPSANRTHDHPESRGHYYHSGRNYNYYHNGSYYNYYHNNEYFLYFIDGAYYNYFYNGAYYVYLVNGRYYNYFYNGAYYQTCRTIPGYRTRGHWNPSTRVCH